MYSGHIAAARFRRCAQVADHHHAACDSRFTGGSDAPLKRLGQWPAESGPQLDSDSFQFLTRHDSPESYHGPRFPGHLVHRQVLQPQDGWQRPSHLTSHSLGLRLELGAVRRSSSRTVPSTRWNDRYKTFVRNRSSRVVASRSRFMSATASGLFEWNASASCIADDSPTLPIDSLGRRRDNQFRLSQRIRAARTRASYA